jgi:phage FluMu protein Com
MKDLKEYRCFTCNHLLYKYSIQIGSKDSIIIEIKCGKCNTLKSLEIDLNYLLKFYSKLKEDKQE